MVKAAHDDYFHNAFTFQLYPHTFRCILCHPIPYQLSVVFTAAPVNTWATAVLAAIMSRESPSGPSSSGSKLAPSMTVASISGIWGIAASAASSYAISTPRSRTRTYPISVSRRSTWNVRRTCYKELQNNIMFSIPTYVSFLILIFHLTFEKLFPQHPWSGV